MKTMRMALCCALICAATAPLAFAHDAGAAMSAAAGRFLESLTPGQKASASFGFKEDERQNWGFVPRPRKGLPFKEMTVPQRVKALELLGAGLSAQGYGTATNIMSLELILRDLEAAAPKHARDPELYFFSIFGDPAGKEPWAWRVEGHHMAVNFTLDGKGNVAGTPTFFGANPAEVKDGPRKGLRVLAAEEDLARELVTALSEEQRKSAIFSTTAPREIITGSQRKVKPFGEEGITAGQLTPAQNEILTRLIKTYVTRMRPEIAEEELAAMQKAGWDKIRFAWAGGLKRGEGHYYRVQGPGFVLEYDNTQNNAYHVHSAWRDFDGDFGEDLLRAHYEQSPH